MLSFAGSLKVFVALGPCDLRKSFDGLHALVTERLQEAPQTGALFVFTNRRHIRPVQTAIGTVNDAVVGERIASAPYPFGQHPAIERRTPKRTPTERLEAVGEQRRACLIRQ
jgi:transposase